MPGTILVADDSPTIQRQASGILTGEGHEVVTVANGVAAIKKLPTVKPLMVLADVSMPGRDGYEVCQIIKQSPETRDVPVLLIFSDLEPYDPARGAQVGADGSVKKPFAQEELVDWVKKFEERLQAAPAPRPAAPPPPPPVAPEPAEPEEAVQPAAEPEFSSIPEGVAFFEEEVPVVEAEPHGHEAAVESASPELVEDPVAPFQEEHAHPHPHSHPHEETPIFEAPEEIAEPILSDESEPGQPAIEAAVAEAPAPPEITSSENVQGGESVSEEPAIPAVEAPPPELEVVTEETQPSEAVFESTVQPEPESGPATSAEVVNEAAAPPAAGGLTREQVYGIVHQTVVKMSPPALSSTAIEEIANRLTDEILAGR